MVIVLSMLSFPLKDSVSSKKLKIKSLQIYPTYLS